MRLFFFFLLSLSVFGGIPKTFTELNLVTNQVLKFETNQSKSRVFIFLSSTCPCSRNFFDYLNELQTKYKDHVQFVGFHSSKFIKDEKAMKYLSKYTFNFPVFRDQGLKYANSLNALKTPHVFVVSSEDKILFQGGVADSRDPKRADEFYLNDALLSLSKNKEIKNKIVRTLGCYIQR